VSLLGALLLLIGAGFSLVAALGVVRMPDVYTRMHAATKAGVLGAGLVLLGAAAVTGSQGVLLRALATVAFLVLTAPVASHLIARAALQSGRSPLWAGTIRNELEQTPEAPDARDPDPPARPPA
jgi:multicomponent Na+:H+ antiporter subunit G